jgi:hypothetical protein
MLNGPTTTSVDNQGEPASSQLSEDARMNLENMIINLQKQLIEKTKTIREFTSNQGENRPTFRNEVDESRSPETTSKSVPNDMQNMITMLQKQLIEKTRTIREMTQSSANNDTGSTSKICQLEGLISMLQKQLVDKNKEIQDLQKAAAPTFTRIPIQIDEPVAISKSKCEPEITVSAED